MNSVLQNILNECHLNEIRIDVCDNNLELDFKQQPSEQLVEQLKRHKQGLIELIKERKRLGLSGGARELAPLSFTQKGLWFIDHMTGNSQHYHLPFILDVKGDVDVKAVSQSLNALVTRHQVLRTVYVRHGEDICQQVQSIEEVPITLHDLSDLPSTKQSQRLAQLELSAATDDFDLSCDLMLRVVLCKLSKQHWTLCITLHHIAADGWSMDIFIREFCQLYSHFTADTPLNLPMLTHQYTDYAYWQRRILQGEVLQTHLNYWQRHLGSIAQLHAVPLDKPRPKQPSYCGEVYHQTLSLALCENISNFVAKHKSTLFTLLKSSLSLLLARLTHCDNFTIGSPVAARTDKHNEQLIGYYANTLVFNTEIPSSQSFVDFIEHNRSEVLNAIAHQHIPMDMLVESLEPLRSLSFNPLFQVMMTVHNYQTSKIELPRLSISNSPRPIQHTKFDLQISVYERAEGIEIDWVYARDIFESETIEGLAKGLSVMLSSALRNPQIDIHRLPISEDILSLHSVKSEPKKEFNSVWNALREHAITSPLDGIMIYGNKVVSYVDLRHLTAKLTQAARKLGIAGKPVTLLVSQPEHCLAMLIALSRLDCEIIFGQCHRTDKKRLKPQMTITDSCAFLQSQKVRSISQLLEQATEEDDTTLGAGQYSIWFENPNTGEWENIQGSAFEQQAILLSDLSNVGKNSKLYWQLNDYMHLYLLKAFTALYSGATLCNSKFECTHKFVSLAGALQLLTHKESLQGIVLLGANVHHHALAAQIAKDMPTVCLAMLEQSLLPIFWHRYENDGAIAAAGEMPGVRYQLQDKLGYSVSGNVPADVVIEHQSKSNISSKNRVKLQLADKAYIPRMQVIQMPQPDNKRKGLVIDFAMISAVIKQHPLVLDANVYFGADTKVAVQVLATPKDSEALALLKEKLKTLCRAQLADYLQVQAWNIVTCDDVNEFSMPSEVALQEQKFCDSLNQYCQQTLPHGFLQNAPVNLSDRHQYEVKNSQQLLEKVHNIAHGIGVSVLSVFITLLQCTVKGQLGISGHYLQLNLKEQDATSQNTLVVVNFDDCTPLSESVYAIHQLLDKGYVAGVSEQRKLQLANEHIDKVAPIGLWVSDSVQGLDSNSGVLINSPMSLVVLQDSEATKVHFDIASEVMDDATASAFLNKFEQLTDWMQDAPMTPASSLLGKFQQNTKNKLSQLKKAFSFK